MDNLGRDMERAFWILLALVGIGGVGTGIAITWFLRWLRG